MFERFRGRPKSEHRKVNTREDIFKKPPFDELIVTFEKNAANDQAPLRVLKDNLSEICLASADKDVDIATSYAKLSELTGVALTHATTKRTFPQRRELEELKRSYDKVVEAHRINPSTTKAKPPMRSTTKRS